MDPTGAPLALNIFSIRFQSDMPECGIFNRCVTAVTPLQFLQSACNPRCLKAASLTDARLLLHRCNFPTRLQC